MTKVVLKDFRKTKELTLPETSITLTVYSSLLVGDVHTVKVDNDDLGSNLEMLIRLIKEWNWYEKEEDEKAVEITVDNLKRLPLADLTAILNGITGFNSTEKKN